MFDRLMSILKSMFNKGMAKMETPEVLAEQAEMELESNFKKITEALTASIANEKLLEGKVKKTTEDLATWEKRALVAVQQNNDEMARQCLSKKQENAQALQQLEAQLVEQKKTTAMLKERHAELNAKLKDFRMKKSELMSRIQANDSMNKANALISGSGGTPSSMDKWEQKIAEKEALSIAQREISGITKADDDFKQWDKQAGLDDELAKLKAIAASGGGGGGMKLVEAKNPPKEHVDDNLPMIVDVEEIKSVDDDKK